MTVDVKTVGDSDKGEVGDREVTIRERDSMEQIRLPISEVDAVFARLLDEGVAWAEVARGYSAADA